LLLCSFNNPFPKLVSLILPHTTCAL
jgi:hypothetical protein